MILSGQRTVIIQYADSTPPGAHQRLRTYRGGSASRVGPASAHAGTGDRRPSAGGTGIFAGASGTGTGRVDGSSLAQRNPDGSCSMDLLPKHERDAVSGSGTLTF